MSCATTSTRTVAFLFCKIPSRPPRSASAHVNFSPHLNPRPLSRSCASVSPVLLSLYSDARWLNLPGTLCTIRKGKPPQKTRGGSLHFPTTETLHLFSDQSPCGITISQNLPRRREVRCYCRREVRWQSGETAASGDTASWSLPPWLGAALSLPRPLLPQH